MRSILNISEAYSLALHATALLASNGGSPATTRGIAAALGVSEAHLSKVLQRLAKAGVLRSSRGPGGGFCLDRAASGITLLDLYEGVEGQLKLADCLIGTRICGGRSCVFDGLIEKVNRQFRDYLEHTTVDRIKYALRRDGDDQKDSADR